MIADIAKTPCAVTGPDDFTYLFFNHPMVGGTDIVFAGGDGGEKRMVFGDDEKLHAYRCLHYLRAPASGGAPGMPRPVPYHDTNAPDSALYTPLYEVITPQAGVQPGRPGLALSFWTNLAEAATTLEQDGNEYIYDPLKVLRFDNNALGDIDLDSYSWKLLCTAQIVWDRMTLTGGTQGYADTKPLPVPVVTHVAITLALQGNLAIDFGAGGGGGGMTRHNHADNSRGGFAYAVWAPGCTLNPVNWY